MATALPRVHEILEAVGLGPDYSEVSPTVLALARDRGAAVHEAIEAEILGYPYSLLVAYEPYLEAYHAFVKDSGWKADPEQTERRVVSARWRYCGHPDAVGFLQGVRTMPDFKCQDSMDAAKLRAAARQLAGYRIAWHEQHAREPLQATVVLQLRGDGTYRLHEVDAAAKESVFLAAVTIYHERRER